jgi:hypothetical protein
MRSAFLVSIACLTASAPIPAFSGDEPGALRTEAGADAEYTRAVEKRADDILRVLGLDDPAKAARVRSAVIAQYRGLRGLQDSRDAKIKSLKEGTHSDQGESETQIRAERERTEAAAVALNQTFLETLLADLSPEQVESVKDTMTYNKLRVTYHAYVDMLPMLTPEQKQRVFDMLKEARDQATYAGSAEEKSEIFNKHKGRINNYLSAQGYDLKRASKEWAERRNRSK